MSSYNFKIVLLGEGCVGKTSLVLRYVSNVFDDAHQSTLQASFLKKQIYLDQDQVKLSIWDTAGQEKFHALGPIYYRESNGALLVYDVLCPKSLDKARVWAKELRNMLGDNVCIAIVANKIDLLPIAEQRNPNTNALIAEALTLCNQLHNARHHLTSAKTDSGINELFISLSRRMIAQAKRNGQTTPNNTLYAPGPNRSLTVANGPSAAEQTNESKCAC